jgi:DNA polymerase-1
VRQPCGCSEQRPRLLLIDGHSIAYRAFFALPVENFSTRTGQHTNAVFGFTSMLINVLRDENPTHVGVAFDVSRGYSRLDPPPSASELDEFYRVAYYASAGGRRAPDLARLSADDERTIREREWRSGPVSTSDLHRGPGRLPTGHRPRHRALPRRGVSDLARMTPAAVEERHFATPAAIPSSPHWSESSDNLPGVPWPASRPPPVARDLRRSGQPRRACRRAQGQGGESRERIEDVVRNRRVNALIGIWSSMSASRTWPGGRGTGRRPISFDGLEFRVLWDRLLETLPAEDLAPEWVESSGLSWSG